MKRPDWLKLPPPVVFGLIVAGVLGLGWAVVYLPQLQTASLQKGVEDYRSSLPQPDPKELATLEKGRIDSENAIRAALIQGLGGTAILVSIYFTYRNLKVAEDKQVTERFSKAVEMLSNVSMHTRLGGIYALERIANDSDRDYPQVMEVLCAFVREESPWPPKKPDSGEKLGQVEKPPVGLFTLAPKRELNQKTGVHVGLLEVERRDRADKFIAEQPLRTDIQAVMTVISRRKHRYGVGEWETQRLDLSYTDLRRLEVNKANFTGINLYEAHLEGARLCEAHFEAAYLYETHLEAAYLERAHFGEVDLRRAHVECAELWEAHLKGACLEGLNLGNVVGLTQAQLGVATTDEHTILPYELRSQPQPPTPATPTPSTPPPAPPAAPSAATAEPASQSTPDPSAEPQPPAT